VPVTGRKNEPKAWVTGKITGCDFPHAKRLVRGTRRYIEAALGDYKRAYRGVPDAIVVHPAQVGELLDVLDSLVGALESFAGIAIVVDTLCTRPRMVGREGQMLEF
jgi:hypothetical protein